MTDIIVNIINGDINGIKLNIQLCDTDLLLNYVIFIYNIYLIGKLDDTKFIRFLYYYVNSNKYNKKLKKYIDNPPNINILNLINMRNDLNKLDNRLTMYDNITKKRKMIYHCDIIIMNKNINMMLKAYEDNICEYINIPNMNKDKVIDEIHDRLSTLYKIIGRDIFRFFEIDIISNDEYDGFSVKKKIKYYKYIISNIKTNNNLMLNYKKIKDKLSYIMISIEKDI